MVAFASVSRRRASRAIASVISSESVVANSLPIRSARSPRVGEIAVVGERDAVVAESGDTIGWEFSHTEEPVVE